MKKTIFNFLYIALLIPFLTSCGYNELVKFDEEANSAWANVEDAYKRRADLIPNLQKIVEGSANFEKETLESVIEARAKATSVQVDPSKATPEQMKNFMDAQNGLGGALSRLLATFERYPQLKSTDAFRDFQAQLEGTENRISVARQRYNDVVKDYNSYRRSAPQVAYAKMLGFGEKAYFEASEKEKETPQIDFNFGDKKE